MKWLNANYGGKQVNDTEHALNSVSDDLTSPRAKTWMTSTKLPWKAKRKLVKIQLIVHHLTPKSSRKETKQFAKLGMESIFEKEFILF